MKPLFSITADSVPVTGHIRDHLVTLRLTDKDGMEADTLEITLVDPTARIALPRRGVTLAVSIGWEGKPLVDKGSFTVDEVGEDGPPDVITIVARAADFRASLKDSREASYNQTTLGAVLETVAARQGLTPAIHPDLAAKPIRHLDQTNESDANLVTRLGKDYGAVATIKAGRLIFVPKGKGLAASGSALPTVKIVRQDGDRHTFRATDRDGNQTGVQAKWHDLSTGNTMFALAGKEGSVKTLKKTYPTQAEALAAAQADWNRIKSQAHEFNVTLALGRPDVIAGAPLVLEGWRSEITGLNWITGPVKHEMDGGGGFTTAVDASEFMDDG